MQITKKVTALGAGLGLFAASLTAIPLGGPVSAAALDSGSNAAVDVQTDLNCSTHTLTAKVTNKTAADLMPEVTFNTLEPIFPSDLPIEAGETNYYLHSYSGNNVPVEVKVAVDTYEPIKLNSFLNCAEPISFMVTQASESAVGGMLTNNSTLVAQVALTQVGSGDMRVENLAPGESRFVAMPFTGFPGQETAYVTIGTTTGFQSSYWVDLQQPPIMPLPDPGED